MDHFLYQVCNFILQSALWKNHRFFSTDVQKRKLEEEGLHVIPCGMNQESLRVENYKEYIYDYADIDV